MTSYRCTGAIMKNNAHCYTGGVYSSLEAQWDQLFHLVQVVQGGQGDPWGPVDEAEEHFDYVYWGIKLVMTVWLVVIIHNILGK